MRPSRRNSSLSLTALLALVVSCCALALGGGIASASSKDVIKDCSEDGSIDGSYTKSELEQARKKLPADLDEYTDCRDAIADAIANPSGADDDAAATASGAGPGGGFGGGVPSPTAPVAGSTATDEAALEEQRKGAEKGGAPSIPVDGKQIKPATGPFAPVDAINQLPLPVLLGLITMLVLASGAGLMALRSRLSPEVLARLPAFMRGEGTGIQWRDRVAGLRRVSFGRFRR